MSGLLLDTSAVSAAMAGSTQLDTFLATVEPSTRIFTSVIVEAEIRFGLARLEDGRRRVALTAAFEEVLSTLHDILSASRAVADDYGQVKAELWASGNPIGENDLWIAATARVHELRVVTGDNDFDAVPSLRVAHWSAH